MTKICWFFVEINERTGGPNNWYGYELQQNPWPRKTVLVPPPLVIYSSVQNYWEFFAMGKLIYNVWQKKRYSKNQRCFIQAVISSNYVGINQQFLFSQYHVLKESQTCAAVPSNLRKSRSKFNVTDAKFKLEFPEDMAHWKIKKERDNHG